MTAAPNAVEKQNSNPLPGSADAVAGEIAEKIQKLVNFKIEDGDRIAAQIKEILTERMGQFDDMRMGRILGHAIATI